MKPLIDCDVLRYEVGFGSEWLNEEKEKQISHFDSVAELFDHKINTICEEVWADSPPLLYLTGDRSTVNKALKRGILSIAPFENYVPNFREAIAVSKEYKGNRPSVKPFHFNNLTSYILTHYDCKIATGLEADDLLSIDHTLDKENTIICSRDKDLRITPGWHYGWECGKQLGFGPMEISEEGFLNDPKQSKFLGGGLKLFYSQLLSGDSVDNIPGLARVGPGFAYKLLAEASSEEEMFELVRGTYEQRLGDEWREYMREQAALLWMIRELDEEGNPVYHKLYDERE